MKRPVGRPKQEDTTVIFVRLPNKLVSQLRERASKDDRELSTVIRRILDGTDDSVAGHA